jgi:hypothetical protein
MSNPIEPSNDEQTESSFGQMDAEHEFEARAGFTAHSITGGKGPGLVEGENE